MLFIFALSFLMSFEIQAQGLWKTVYECNNGEKVRAILLQNNSQFQLHGVKCLISNCYLIEESYDFYNLQLVSTGKYQGEDINVIENVEEKTINIIIIAGNFPPGIYNCDFK
jgi:hypothetical protein